MSGIKELLSVQVHDPAKGSFIVRPKAINVHGRVKTARCSDGLKRIVYRGDNHESFEYVIMDGTVTYV
jgi:hypothetical protein